jgi:hypothetical protein
MVMWTGGWGRMGTGLQKPNKSALFTVDGLALD